MLTSDHFIEKQLLRTTIEIHTPKGFETLVSVSQEEHTIVGAHRDAPLQIKDATLYQGRIPLVSALIFAICL